jgi:hypothetical protein
MSDNSFKIKNSGVFTPKDLSTLVNPEIGEIACDISDNKIKQYNGFVWEELNKEFVPSVQPTLDLNFAETRSLPSEVTFSRDSIGSFVNKLGLLELAPANQPRFDHNPDTMESLGLLVEESRQNLLQYSENFDNSYWTKFNASIQADLEIAPDGTRTADGISDNTTSDVHACRVNLTKAASATTYTASVFAKAANSDKIFLSVSDGGTTNRAYVIYNLITLQNLESSTTGTFSAPSFNIQQFPNGWCRVSLTVRTGTEAGIQYQIRTLGAAINTTYVGSGDLRLYIWGAQLEVGSFPTSYIPSTNSLTSRSSSASYIDSDGLIKYAANNVARSNYRADKLQLAPKLLLEESRQNLLQYSENFDNSAWDKTRSRILADVEIAPDGTLTGDKLVEDTSTNTHFVAFTSLSVTAGTFYSISCFVKASERTDIFLGVAGVGFNTSTGAYFNLLSETPGLITDNASNPIIQRFSNDWYKVSCTVVAQATGSASFRIHSSIGASAGNFSYTGDGVSGLYIWGAQLEVGSYPTSYIPSANSFTSRASSASFVDSDGLIKLAATNVARQNYRAGRLDLAPKLLLEESRQNLFQYSENFDNAGWTKSGCSIQADLEIAPDGTRTADKLVQGTSSGDNSISFSNISYISGNSYTVSVFTKASQNSVIRIGLSAAAFTTAPVLRLDLASETNNNTGPVQNFGFQKLSNSWYRVWFTAVATASVTASATIGVLPTTGTSTPYTGDGVSGIFIWGAQLEVGAYPTSYIPSTNTFTSRASTATFIGSNGLIQSAAINVARQNYNPTNLALAPKLLLEESRQNLLQRSEEFNDVYWTKSSSSITANAAVAPNGTTTADKIVEDVSNNAHSISNISSSYTQNTTYTLSIFVKPAERSVLRLGFPNAAFSGGAVARFDLSTNSIDYTGNTLAVGNIVPYSNGWYRVSITATATATVFGTLSYTLLETLTGNIVYTGDGTSGLFIWGAQLEVGAYPTSYIPTTTAAVTRSADVSSSAATTRSADVSSSAATTRAADVSSSVATIRRADLASMTGSNFTSWYRDDEGTFLSKFENTRFNTNSYIWSVNDNSLNNQIQMRTRVDIGGLQFIVRTNSSDVAVFNDSSFGTNYISGSTVVYVGAYKLNDTNAALSGSIGVTDTSVTLPSNITQLNIGSRGPAGSEVMTGHVAKLTFYPKRLSNNDIRLLSKK